jgi:hypothetical protein
MRTIPRTFAEVESVPTEMESPVAPFLYREMAHQPLVEMDSIERLNSNLRQLDDLYGRLKFVMHELKTVIKP